MTASPFPYIARGNQRFVFLRSKTFNIDNGSGTTDDDVLFADFDVDAYVMHVRAVYIEATDTAGAASANFKLGTAAGGAQVVAATALEVSKAVGSATVASLVDGGQKVPAGSSLFARHTGIASTEAGQYYLQVLVMLAP
jgi:hypothetical protein